MSWRSSIADRWRITAPLIAPPGEFREGLAIAARSLDALHRQHGPGDLAGHGLRDLVFINNQAPVRLQRIVLQLATCFRREFGYDAVQWETNEPLEGHPAHERNAFLFIGRELEAIGAICFRWRRYRDAPAGWASQWAWMHPYARRRGHLSRAWPIFRKLYGDFAVEGPLSESGKAFIDKHGGRVG